MDGIDFITPIPEDRKNEVITHLRNNFMLDEPLCKSIGLYEPGKPDEEMEAHCLESVSLQLSVMAVDKKSGKIAAVFLSGIAHPGDVQERMKYFENVTNEKLVKILTFIYDHCSSLNLLTKYNVENILEGFILSVDSNYRERGLGKKCIEMREKVAKENGFQMMKAVASGMFSQKIFSSLGWECINELKYKDYVDADGNPIFKPDPPHESAKVFVKRIK